MGSTTLRVTTSSGEVRLQGPEPVSIGRSRDSAVQVNDSKVSRQHVLLSPSATGWRAVDKSANGIWRDGRRISELELASGEEARIRLGGVDGPEVVLAAVPAAASPAPPAGLASPAGPASLSSPARPSSPAGLPSPAGPGPGPGGPGRPAAPLQPASGSAPAPSDAAELSARGTSRHGQAGQHGPGGPASGAIDLSTSANPAVPTARKVHAISAGRIRLGRSRDNDVTVPDLLASRHHAEIYLHPNGAAEVVDLGTANGTFVNGQRVARAPISQRDVIAVGHHLFQLDGASLVEYRDSGDVAFEAQSLNVWAGTKQLMHDMTFRLPARSLLGVVGPSGAGKSTLLNALTGFRPADAGTVRYAGRDLYDEYDELRRRIGYVPQADPLHAQLTVKEALEYGAELRFPADTTADERRVRVDEVIGELGLTQHADTPVSRLSGGQKKRTSVALELLTRPSLLFLDEPTSGLDPANDKAVMDTLRNLAKGGGAGSADEQGRTVIVVTHSVLFLDRCDYVLVLSPGGYIAYFGPPDGALSYFHRADFKDFVDTFRELEETPGEQMAAQFRGSEYYVPSAMVAPLVRTAPPALASVRQQPVSFQLSTLTRRYLKVIIADRSYLRLIALFPILLGVIPRVIPAPHGLGVIANRPNGDAAKVLVVLMLCACFMGMANSVREIVKERDIYRRERTIGLSRTAYLGSKVVVLTGITTVQCFVFTLIGLLGRTPPEAAVLGSPLLECLVAIIVAALASMMIGLFVSTLVDNADKTMPFLVLVTMAQLVLSGGLITVSNSVGLAQLSWLAPARWGFAAMASTDDLNAVEFLGRTPDSDPRDVLWNHTAGVWLLDIVLAMVIGAVMLYLTTVMLRRIEPKVGRPAAVGVAAGAVAAYAGPSSGAPGYAAPGYAPPAGPGAYPPVTGPPSGAMQWPQQPGSPQAPGQWGGPAG
ncbi:ATP-binding cassette domain-containing protein [Pseudofrankia inefficax]|uniref:ATP-binding cassette domain-containing protein n=1 Tax=Pseudofrankia inefficax (strain DSM 45817 / CECT 9037 / DDB 130130 / EuI1c) TaxID=298654 RepID=UPI000A04167E|nr:ATP-binding cassette domain-containing protein [Pseudofrankia inefficax]